MLRRFDWKKELDQPTRATKCTTVRWRNRERLWTPPSCTGQNTCLQLGPNLSHAHISLLNVHDSFHTSFDTVHCPVPAFTWPPSIQLLSCFMIMSALGVGMMSASHWAWMKWINKPVGAELEGVVVCFVWTIALGDQLRQILSVFRWLLWTTCRRSRKKNQIIHQPSEGFVANFTRLCVFGGAAGRPSGRLPGVGLSRLLSFKSRFTGASALFFSALFPDV